MCCPVRKLSGVTALSTCGLLLACMTKPGQWWILATIASLPAEPKANNNYGMLAQ